MSLALLKWQQISAVTNALVDEWNNIPMWTVNALVNSAASARGGGGGVRRGANKILITAVKCHFQLWEGVGRYLSMSMNNW